MGNPKLFTYGGEIFIDYGGAHMLHKYAGEII